MPELPEVETTMRGLAPHWLNREIRSVEVRRHDLRWPIPGNIEELLTEQRITGLRRLGKYIVAELSNGWALIIHLGMSGSFRVEPHYPASPKKHDHVFVEMESGIWAVFHDPRRFGALLACRTEELQAHPLLSKMGPDPLDVAAFTPAYLRARLAKASIPIKVALMDQKYVAGIGNIYASEALFESGVHPLRPANSLSKEEAERLVPAIRQVLEAAIQSGGSTLRDYMSGAGETGYFKHAFKVYDKEGAACLSCGKTVDKLVMAGRSTYFCVSCQKWENIA